MKRINKSMKKTLKDWIGISWVVPLPNNIGKSSYSSGSPTKNVRILGDYF